MELVFYISGAIAVLSTIGVVTRLNAVHALLYLVVSLLAVALVFYSLGAPFVAALEVIIYAGAIMVLFIFVVMLLNLGPQGSPEEREWLRLRNWAGPAALSLLLALELLYALLLGGMVKDAPASAGVVEAKQVSLALFGPYVLGVELASMLLLSGLVGAYHLGRQGRGREPEQAAVGGGESEDMSRPAVPIAGGNISPREGRRGEACLAPTATAGDNRTPSREKEGQ